MNLEEWFSWYNEILDVFGFDKEMDEKSSEILRKLLKDKNSLSPPDLTIKPNTIIFGAGPSLKRNLKELKNLKLDDFTIICADGAVTALLEEEMIPDVVVTNLMVRLKI